ncbi:hypothetical protein IGI04_002874 [Brassica rapa subsp. trilocularis]|uniref:Uncharacterized protein n=1 Tax=Brassica rapa subsp. trilocularis TaxID=1813537 RepID=A0ABQ7NWT2_BRACM|nr:hypothetical protein IGI04_002874 [Brassica rapa subsp. trilocularis]
MEVVSSHLERHIHHGRASQSDLSERPTEVAPSQSDQSRATTSSHSQPEPPARATSSSHSRFDASRHKKTRRERPPGATMLGRSACFAWTIFMLFQGPFVKYFVSHGRQDNLFSREELSIHNASSELATQKLINRHFSPKRLKVDSLIDRLPSLVRYLITQGLIPMPMSQEELCFINNNGSWYKKEPTFSTTTTNSNPIQPTTRVVIRLETTSKAAISLSKTPRLTRSEKHVGYELKNLHTKIDGSYNELNNKFSHLASTRHIHPGRASQSDLSERPTEVAPSQSDQSRATTSSHSQPEPPAQVTRVLTRRDTKKRVGSDLLERLC